jgi:O-antigen ligase
MLAGFLAMVFLIPFDGIDLKVHLGVDSKPDRVFLVLILGALLVKAATSRIRGRGRRLTPIERAVLIFTAVALLSMVLNIDRIYQLNQLSFAEKRVSQLLSYVTFFFVVVAIVRPAEMMAFAKLILGLTVLTAVGTLYEARSGYNVFYLWSAKLLHPIATVLASPTIIHPVDGNRPQVVGPTDHGLALTSMLTIALPFAILPLLEAKQLGKRVLYLVIIGLILAAELATDRKTAVVAPLAMLVVLMAYRRQLLRWVPIGLIALIPVIHVVSPGTLGTITNITATGGSSASTAGRVNDYSAVAPDILSNLAIGRGYGTLDPDNWTWYRILDNEYLDELFQVGVIGLVAYLAIIVSALVTAHPLIRAGGDRAPPVLAAAAGCAAYATVSATFDALAYPQAPYMFLFAAGLITVTAKERAALGGAVRPRFVSMRRSAPPRTRPTATVASAAAPGDSCASAELPERLYHLGRRRA